MTVESEDEGGIHIIGSLSNDDDDAEDDAW